MPSEPRRAGKPPEGVDHGINFKKKLAHYKQEVQWRDIFLFLLAFRILNALSIRTFFQPDEYFQSLEPAWQMTFGSDSGAWITWEWQHRLRSSIHPAIFAAVYFIASKIATLLHFAPSYTAELLVAAPHVLQAISAALCDYYTAKLAEKLYGRGSNAAWATLALTVCSPWQWFCSSRTLSNCLETTLTISALFLWPWHRFRGFPRESEKQGDDSARSARAELRKLRLCLILAASASILRPTNLLIWLCLSTFAVLDGFNLCPYWNPVAWVKAPSATPSQTSKRELLLLVRESVLSLVLAISAFSDRLYYGVWTFPPYHFLHFNIAQSLAVFYGRNDWHYYLSQGIPLLLTTALPFGLLGLWQAIRQPLSSKKTTTSSQARADEIRYQLALTVVILVSTLSLISHKEVRFIYPLLPILHILASQPLATFFTSASSAQESKSEEHDNGSPNNLTPKQSTLRKGVPLYVLLFLNIAIAYYTTQVHQSGPLSVMAHLRQEHEKRNLAVSPASSLSTDSASDSDTFSTVGFLMPCHSTPWRSHLVYPNLHAWALGCEPPISLNPAERAVYVDEADRFYANPLEFLRTEMALIPRNKVYVDENITKAGNKNNVQKYWPQYLVFFEQAEPTLRTFFNDLAASKETRELYENISYRECWRTFNTHWHDDWRRKGDIVIWCRQRSH
ncbi:glycosyltransferase family 22 protein [Xylona heveae TC161]|uniref:Mannosyltransferase n=1 Tax=Xylona heveae (strain CBS 132557 / TC161) TaxID=1328760 RepID=A0A165IE35_XYLHT|nr:glycosyltransferase family 22 protein [Xylona heveae TC161]KZF24764.1 glycosyltransferase family 22 protein [Xylona heveae TC161]